MIGNLSSEQIFVVAQGVVSFLLTIGIGLACWFVNKLFAEIEKSRNNERELYKLIEHTHREVCKAREDMLKIEVDRLKEENSRLHK